MGTEYVETTGSGSVAVVPDRAVLRFRFVQDAADVAAALDACAATVRAVLVVLDETAGAGHVRQTGSITVADHWDDQRQRTSGYDATQALAVRLDDPVLIGAVVATVSAAAGAAFRMDGLTWAATQVEAAQREAREQALHDARARAEQLAAAGGRGLGTLVRVTERDDAGGGPPVLRAMKADAVGAMPAEAGEGAVEVSVTARWLLVG